MTDRSAEPRAEDVLLPAHAEARELRRALLDWFAEHRRDLPWRRTHDPYGVWISEAMLQQTRVETVVPYYERFLARYPDVEALASAPVEDVLELWSGLGYYRRARSLQRAAQVVRDEHGGFFPRDREAVLALPGVGPYTAGAVLSIAFDEPEALVDGNVARVFSRLFALEGALGSREAERDLWAVARALLPPPDPGPERLRGPGAWNQALMELGATVCAPRDPACGRCPVARSCRARRDGRVAELPRPKAKRSPIDVELEALWVHEGERVLALRRPEGGRMAGLWELPTRERTPAGAEPRLFPREFPRGAGGAPLAAGRALADLRHGITHHRIRLRVRAGSAARSAGAREAGDARRAEWVPLGELRGRALTGMTRKVLASAFLEELPLFPGHVAGGGGAEKAAAFGYPARPSGRR